MSLYRSLGWLQVAGSPSQPGWVEKQPLLSYLRSPGHVSFRCCWIQVLSCDQQVAPLLLLHHCFPLGGVHQDTLPPKPWRRRCLATLVFLPAQRSSRPPHISNLTVSGCPEFTAAVNSHGDLGAGGGAPHPPSWPESWEGSPWGRHCRWG